jgi:cell division protein FtsI (penicillin-binding protein 3)
MTSTRSYTNHTNHTKRFSTENESHGRLFALGLVALTVWAVMIFRTFHIQVVEGEYYADRAEAQSTKRMIWMPQRGKILDRKGNPLSLNVNIANSKGVLENKRIAPYGSYASQLLGAVGKDGAGMLGLEYSFEEKLRGIEGWSYRRLNASRRYYPGMEKDGREPTPGMNLILTIDVDMQEICETALKKGVLDLDAKRGSAVVVDPHSGEILAMATYPGFNPNELKTLERAKTRNDWIGMSFEPGSTFKIVAVAAALEEKLLGLKDSISGDDGRYVAKGGEIIRDHRVYGNMSLSDAVAYSSNVALAKIATKVGEEDFFRYVRSFGFASATGISLPGEESGRVKELNQWSGRTLVTMAMGHEILATPLQVAMAYSVIANGGKLVQPIIVRQWQDPRSAEIIYNAEPQEVRNVISEETASHLRMMLREVVQKGTGKNLKSWLDIGGKTGTAEKFIASEGKYSKKLNVSSFVGMVPVSNPKFVVMVVVDEPKKHHTGSYAAGPIFKEIVENMYLSPELSSYTNRLLAQNIKSKTHTPNNLVGSRWEGVKGLVAEGEYEIVGNGEFVIAQTETQITLGMLKLGIMPNVKGLSVREAIKILEPNRVKISIEGVGSVVSQYPSAGTTLQALQECKLVLKGDS